MIVHMTVDANIKKNARCLQVELTKRVKFLMGLMCDFPSEVSLRFCDKEEIQNLNKQFRKKNKATDVLSFPAHPNSTTEADFAPPGKGKNPTVNLGDIAICVPVCAEQISSARLLCQELERMVIHGLVHLRGFDHERGTPAWAVMSALERALIKALRSEFGKPLWWQKKGGA